MLWAAPCQLEGCLLRLACRLRLLVLLVLRMRLIVLDICPALDDGLLSRQQLLRKGHDFWICCCDARDGSHAVALSGGLRRGDGSVHSHLSHLDMPVSLADWPAQIGISPAECRSMLMGTLLHSFQSYRCYALSLPCAAAPSLASATALLSLLSGLSYVFVSRRSTTNCLLNQNSFHPSTNTTLLLKV